MSLRWTVLEANGAFRGLELDGIRGKPSMRLEVAAWGRLKLTSRDGPVFWARVDREWESWARISSATARPQAVARIAAPQVRAVKDEPGSEAWWLAWAKHFATALGESKDSPLFASTWWLEPVRTHVRPPPLRPWWDPPLPLPVHWEAVLQELGVREAEPLQANQVVALRRPSAPTADRVKVWRKHARAGTLPPVLLWFVPAALDVFLVIDGHDRLQAAAAEKVVPRFLTLAHAPLIPRGDKTKDNLDAMMRGVEQALSRPNPRLNVASMNSMVLDAHRPSNRQLSARGWPAKGGFRAWEKEVREAASAVGVVPEIIGLL